MDKDGNNGNDYWVLYINSGLIQADLRDNGGATETLTSSATYNDNAWHLIYYIRRGTTIELYVDGTLVDSATKTAFTFSNSVPFVIGWTNYTPAGQSYVGLLDDLRVYNRALTPLEIAALYNGGAGCQ